MRRRAGPSHSAGMPKRPLAVLALIVAIVAPARVSGAVTVSGSTRWHDCTQQIGVFPVDAEAVGHLLPPGHVPVAFQDSSPAGPTGAPAAPGTTAAVQQTATSCTTGAGRAVTVVQFWVYVDPPQSARDERVDAYVVVPWVVASTADASRRLVSFGLPANPGVTTNVQDGSGLVRVGSAS